MSCDRAVLVVEDDHDILDALIEVLAWRDIPALAAANGLEALARLRSAPSRPCLILLDIAMPVMDGLQFRAAQRQDDGLKDIPVVVLSARPDLRKLAMELGAAGYLSKPVEIEALFSTIARLCPRASGG